MSIKEGKKHILWMESEVIMKATGVIRRIDELGRIVIPKEIRKTLRIKEGENLEIYIDENENIILKKYSFMNKIDDLAQDFTDSIYAQYKHDIFIMDCDHIIAASGKKKKDYLGKSLSEEISEYITRRENRLETMKKEINIVDQKEIVGSYAFSPIIVSGDVAGMVFIFSDEDSIREEEYRMIQIASGLLSKHLGE